MSVTLESLPKDVRRTIARRALWAKRAQGNRSLKLLEWCARVSPHRDWTPKHLRFVADHLDRVTRGEIDRLMISAPPRHGKSELTTRHYPVYRMARDPSALVCVGSYNAEQAGRFGREARDIARRALPALSRDRQAATEWNTPQGGTYRGTGVGNPPTGAGFDLILVDDPFVDANDAESRARRELVWSWFDAAIRNRLEPGGAIVIIATRWHEDDLIGRLLDREPEDWTAINLTATAEADDPLGREFGEALWPGRFPLSELAKVMPRQAYLKSALYYGRPTAPEGNLLPVKEIGDISADKWRQMLEDYEDLRDLPVCIGIDLAATDDPKAHYTAGVAMAGPDDDGRYYILEAMRGQWEPKERNEKIREMAGRFPEARIRIPRDALAAAGKEVVVGIQDKLDGWVVIAVRPASSKLPGVSAKEYRAEALIMRMDERKFFLIEAVWPCFYDKGQQLTGHSAREIFLHEGRRFPQEPNDLIDAWVDAHQELAAAGDLGITIGRRAS